MELANSVALFLVFPVIIAGDQVRTYVMYCITLKVHFLSAVAFVIQYSIIHFSWRLLIFFWVNFNTFL